MLGEKYCGGDGRNFEDNYLDFENVDDYDNVDIMISWYHDGDDANEDGDNDDGDKDDSKSAPHLVC